MRFRNIMLTTVTAVALYGCSKSDDIPEVKASKKNFEKIMTLAAMNEECNLGIDMGMTKKVSLNMASELDYSKAEVEGAIGEGIAEGIAASFIVLGKDKFCDLLSEALTKEPWMQFKN